MKNFKGLLIPLFAVGLLVSSSPLLAQEEVFAFEIEEGEINWFVDHILCEYDISVPEAIIINFLSAVLEDSPFPCDMIGPRNYGATASTQTYKWTPTAQAITYSLAGMGLTDGTMFQDQTTNNFYTFENLTPQQYLFVFIADCLDGPSVANILIVDKDVYFQEEGYEQFATCSCRNRDTAIEPNSSCPFYHTATFPWDNTTDINKYRYNISGTIGENPYEAEFWVLYNVATETAEANILGCSDFFIAGDPNSIGDGENFQVVLSTNGAHVYLLNESLGLEDVSAVRCDGFTFDGGTVEYHSIPLSIGKENSDFDVFPNPFSSQLSINTLAAYKGEASLSLLAIDGTLLKYQKIAASEHGSSLLLDVATVPPGLYTLVYEVAGKRFVEKVVKQ